jgi:hypothetical protein
MLKNKARIARWGPIALALGLAVSAFGLTADFDPSTYNPAVAEIVTFAVCQSCVGSGSFVYAWDFNSDGEIDLRTEDPLVTYSFDTTGFHQITLQVIGAGGRTQEVEKGLVVGDAHAVGVRSVLVESDGALLVLVELRVNQRASGIAIEEKISSGWMVEVVDSGGAMVKHNGELRQLEVAWMSIYDPGDGVTFSYRLRSGGSSTPPRLQGEVQGFFTGEWFAMPIAGMVKTP